MPSHGPIASLRLQQRVNLSVSILRRCRSRIATACQSARVDLQPRVNLTCESRACGVVRRAAPGSPGLRHTMRACRCYVDAVGPMRAAGPILRRPSLAPGSRSERCPAPPVADVRALHPASDRPSDPADPGEVRAGPSRVQPPACGSAKKKSEGLASEIIFCYSSCGSSCDGSLALSYSVIFPVGVVCSVYHLSFLYLLVYIYYTIG